MNFDVNSQWTVSGTIFVYSFSYGLQPMAFKL